MKEIKLKKTYKGTRILIGNKKRELLNKMIDVLYFYGFEEIEIPIIQLKETFENKVGKENNNLMFNFKDNGNRDIVLSPEYTSVIQQLSKETYKQEKNVKLFYIQECFRGEKPQKGRYRQFTQLGVEIINPNDSINNNTLVQIVIELLSTLHDISFDSFKVNYEVKRGLDYYNDGKGFEVLCEELGSSKQVCGGGFYNGGCGFSLGIDRLMLIK
jgi:histidyl-tRNA synthetase